MHGSIYALEHSGILLRDAVSLYDQKSFPSAVVLALFGREELGKAIIFRDAFEEAVSGQPVDLKTLKSQYLKHETKQSRGALSVTQRFQNTDPLGEAVLARMHHRPGTAEYEEAERLLEEARAKRQKAIPAERHLIRMSALYVEPSEDGSGWKRPQEQTQDDARYELWDAVNDYSLFYDRVVRGNDDPNAFLTAFQQWTSRPPIVEPVWPRAL